MHLNTVTNASKILEALHFHEITKEQKQTQSQGFFSACYSFLYFYQCVLFDECVFQVWLVYRDVNWEDLSQHRIQIGCTA